MKNTVQNKKKLRQMKSQLEKMIKDTEFSDEEIMIGEAIDSVEYAMMNVGK